MFQRLKGAIDTRIAEEQARQRQATQAGTTRTPARRRPQNENGPVSRSPARPRDAISSEKGPDPNEFEGDLADEDDNLRVEGNTIVETGTADVEKQMGAPNVDEGSVTTDQPADAKENVEKGSGDTMESPAPSDRAPELSTEVRVRLRKLDRLESKYGELLKAYRAAHARVQVVESFETTLKENTPLTSISDPTALVEYLNQVKMKGDMILDEYKKVSAERDEYKKKEERSQKDNASLRTEVEDLKAKAAQVVLPEVIQNVEENVHPLPAGQSPRISSKDVAEPTDATKSPASTASRIPSISMFSPRFGAKKEEPKDVSEDLFSYDSEVPRLEGELQQRLTEVDQLNKQVKSLQGDLKVARDSTEGMVQTLETTTREMNTLRDTNEKLEASKIDFQKQIEDLHNSRNTDTNNAEELQSKIEQLQTRRDEAVSSSEGLRKQLDDLETVKSRLQSQLDELKANAEIINEKLTQKDHIVKDLEDSLAMAKLAEREQADGKASSEKRFATMQGIMDTVRHQLDQAEKTVTELKQDLDVKQVEFANRPSSKIFGFLNEGDVRNIHNQLSTQEEAVDFLADAFGLQKSDTMAQSISTNSTQPIIQESAPGGGAKKKNKKKKKTGTGQSQATDAIETTETINEVAENPIKTNEQAKAVMEDLKKSVGKLCTEIDEKTQMIEKLTGQIRDQDELREEIETLRDDLLHQGEEHVEARDALKTAVEERKALQNKVEALQKEVEDSRTHLASSADQKTKVEALEKEIDDVHKQLASSARIQTQYDELSTKFDELKSNIAAMEKDLKAAEQLAAGRFKDISDLKDLLAKAQPELRNLRSEVAELTTIRNDFKNKQGELSRLEAKHEDLKSEMKGLGRRLSEKDSDIKTLQEKVEQESKARSKVEIELTSTQSELRVAEGKRTEAREYSSQVSQDLARSKEEATSLRAKLRDLEEQLSKQTREATSIREELSLKAALHTSSQSLVQSLRDQTHELSTQAREASARAESLEEELTEAQRMLSERTRESSTMRMLLNQAESGTEARLRELKERVDAAIEERDRIEDEANVTSRRMMREVEEAKTQARSAQRQHKALEDERDDLDSKNREWRRRREELEQASENAAKEVDDIKSAMKTLREALNESERQIQEAESHKSDLRRSSEEAAERVEKLTRANKSLAEEIKVLQQGVIRKGSVRPAGGNNNADSNNSGLQSSRTSIDSSTSRSHVPPVARAISRSETPTLSNNNSSNTGLSQGTVDYVYLKNVLLQFMERKDKGHQRQLIPVLGMLLHFDRMDEQKWMSAISAR